MNPTTLEHFNIACHAFRADPTHANLLWVNRAMLEGLAWPPGVTPSPKHAPAPRPYLPPVATRDWYVVFHGDAFAQDWREIRVEIDRRLDDEEVSRVSGALGYALKQNLAGEELSLPGVCRATDRTFLLYTYDSRTSIRSNPCPELAFARAEEYIQVGTPRRQTDRAGAGTRGTRLVRGIGPCDITFAVR